MDSSPESTAKVNSAVNAATAVNAASSSNSPPVQESPFSNYVSSFSPLNFRNATRMSQVFPALSSPPLIFATPRVNPIHEASLSTGPGNTQVCNEKETEGPHNDNKELHESVDWEKSAMDFDACLTIGRQDPCADNYEQVQCSGSSERVDKYLVDNVEGEPSLSDNSVDQNLKPSGNIDSVDTATGGISEREKERGKQTRIQLDVKEHVVFEGRQEESEEETKDERVEKRKCTNCSSELEDICKSSDSQTEKVGCGGNCNVPSEMRSEHVQTAQAPVDPNDNIEPSIRLANNTVLESEVNQQQRGMSRRCLQFEEAEPKATFNANSPLVVATLLRPSGVSSEIAAFDSNSSSCSRQLTVAYPTMSTDSCPSIKAKQVTPLSKPLGIGLHLNSIVKAASFHPNASLKLVDGSMSILEIRSKAITSSSSLEVGASESHQDPEDLKSMQIIDDHATPIDKRKFVSEDLDNSEQLTQLSPRRKKKKFSSSPDDDGCKQCNCKKTKCLKLYCDCFAAGIYCDASCSCQGCLNKPEHADAVLQTRQQIESRNPLAFAPKIIQRGSDISMNNMESGNLTTPASARHKRGCNCKKSMCLKKYCECYQGGVGCSTGCRCENCKNIYGKKDDYISEEFLNKRAISERSEPDERTETVDAGKASIQAEMHHLQRLTPATPSVQHSDQGKAAPKSQIIIRRCHPAPGSDVRPLQSSDGNDTNLAKCIEVPEMSPYDQETDHSNLEITKYFSSRFSQLVDVSTLSPLQNPLPTPISSSASFYTSPPKLDSISGIYGILEDDTPEFLKDASTTPIKPVKVSSPSRKRVSPPQRRLSESGSSSSGPLRSGRKFILRALPPFPPLTPCIAPDGLTNQVSDDPEEKE